MYSNTTFTFNRMCNRSYHTEHIWMRKLNRTRNLERLLISIIIMNRSGRTAPAMRCDRIMLCTTYHNSLFNLKRCSYRICTNSSFRPFHTFNEINLFRSLQRLFISITIERNRLDQLIMPSFAVHQ